MSPTIENITLQGNELIIRTGEASAPFNPQRTTLQGTIESVESYVGSRNPEPSSARVEYSIDKGTVSIFDREGQPDQYTIVGTLQIDKAYSTLLGMHNDPTQLGDLLRKNRRYFSNPQEGAALVTALKTFKAQVDKQLEKTEDKRAGQYKSVVEKLVSSNLPEKITFLMDVIKGMPPIKFDADIYVDVRDNGVSITLESIEADELIETSKRSIVLACVNEFLRPKGFFCLEL